MAQLVQVEAPVKAYLPARHELHADDVEAPAIDELVPAEHDVHAAVDVAEL
jgi:hypothetical protein